MSQSLPRRPITADPASNSKPNLPPPRLTARVTPDPIEVPDLNRLFYSRKTLQWFGFFQSFTHTLLYLVLITLFFIGTMVSLLNFDIYDDFKRMSNGLTLLFAGTPLLVLFVSNLIAILTFSLTAGNNEDKLCSFLMLNDGVEDNDAHLRCFNTEFALRIKNFRVYVFGFAFIAILFKVSVDLCRLSEHLNSFYSLCLIVFSCYMCLVFVVSNGLIYIAILSCKVHVSVYKDFLNGSVSSVRAVFRHHLRLREVVERFSEKFSWYLGSQILICIWSFIFTSMIMYGNYVNRPELFMLGAADFLCLIAVEIPLFWSVLCGLNDLRLQIESIQKDIDERSEQCQLVSNNPNLARKWESFARNIEYNWGGVRIIYRKVDSSLVLMFGLQFALVILYLGIALNY